MEIKLGTAIASHLSDAQHEMGFNQVRASNRINFVKWLLSRYTDVTAYIDEDILNAEYGTFCRYFDLTDLDG